MDNLNFTTEIQPNMDFIKELTKTGADALQKCYQCSTCSTVCPLSTDTKPFPRKEMMWAQWGQPDKLVYNSDVWLCHQCNDCVDYCPREAKPGDVMASVRRFSFSFLATPGFMGRALQNIKLLPLLLAVP
ncbi:MAG: 4Fe-4S dicluster domain-containing protein, partial [Spirochaetota bacterium]|nr:4Fe-4S dicluster domain-containing protein [Spirochaetota bacterium]